MEIAYTILRTALGLNIFMHGFTRLYNGTKNFRDALEKEFTDSFLPLRWVSLFGIVLPVLETVIGLLLLVGLCTQPAIVGGSLLMLLLIFGKSIKADWQTVSLQMIYIAFYAVLASSGNFNTISLDNLFLNL
jgi:thiosulfate dehydrogenase [quinone] large subunit